MLDLGELGSIREDHVVRWSYCGGNFCGCVPQAAGGKNAGAGQNGRLSQCIGRVVGWFGDYLCECFKNNPFLVHKSGVLSKLLP